MRKIIHYLAKTYHLSAHPLTSESKERCKERMLQRYFPHLTDFVFPLYLQFSPGIGTIQTDSPQAWKKIVKILQETEIILFFDEHVEETFFQLQKSHSLRQMFEELQLLNLYISNPQQDFLVCYSDFERIYAWGKARDWITSIP